MTKRNTFTAKQPEGRGARCLSDINTKSERAQPKQNGRQPRQEEYNTKPETPSAATLQCPPLLESRSPAGASGTFVSRIERRSTTVKLRHSHQRKNQNDNRQQEASFYHALPRHVTTDHPR